MSKWVTDCIRDISKFLSRIVVYRDKNIELLPEAQQEMIPLLFVANYHNYSRYLTYHHFENKLLTL